MFLVLSGVGDSPDKAYQTCRSRRSFSIRSHSERQRAFVPDNAPSFVFSQNSLNMNPALRALKNTIRKDMRQRLAALSKDEIKRQCNCMFNNFHVLIKQQRDKKKRRVPSHFYLLTRILLLLFAFGITAAIVTEKLVASRTFKESQNISVYISMHGEICTTEIIRTVLSQSKEEGVAEVPVPFLINLFNFAFFFC